MHLSFYPTVTFGCFLFSVLANPRALAENEFMSRELLLPSGTPSPTLSNSISVAPPTKVLGIRASTPTSTPVAPPPPDSQCILISHNGNTTGWTKNPKLTLKITATHLDSIVIFWQRRLNTVYYGQGISEPSPNYRIGAALMGDGEDAHAKIEKLKNTKPWKDKVLNAAILAANQIEIGKLKQIIEEGPIIVNPAEGYTKYVTKVPNDGGSATYWVYTRGTPGIVNGPLDKPLQ